MSKRPNWNDLGTIEAVLKQVAAILEGLKAIAHLDGVAGAVELLGQLEDAVSDIAADVEIELNEGNRR